MNDRTLIRVGMVGLVGAVLCCTTPVLIVALGTIGLSGGAAWFDPYLVPVAAAFGGLLAYGIYRRQHRAASSSSHSTNVQ